MRKSLALLIILTLLSGYGIYWAGTTVGAEEDKVQFTEHVIYGDKSVVEGVKVIRNTKYQEYMYWNSVYTIGDEAKEVETDFRFYEFGKDEKWERHYNGIWFDNVNYDINFDEDGYTDGRAEKAQGLEKAFYDFAKDAPAGKTTYKKIKLKDYMEYYTFGLQVNLPGVFMDYTKMVDSSSYTENELKQVEKFNEFFKIPVLEDENYVLGVTKDKAGKVIGYGYQSANGGGSYNNFDYPEANVAGDGFIFDTSAAYTDDTCYFTFLPLTADEKVIDMSLIPGGYGIYSFKYDSKKETFDADSLKLEYALEPGWYVGLKVDAQQENLLVFTEDDEQFYLQVIDLDTMKEKQKIAYGKMNEEDLARCYFVEEDFLIAQYDYYEAMLFSRNADGTYTPEYTIPGERLEVSENAYFLSGDCVFDWDGEKLLVADSLTTGEPHYEELCGFFLAAFDKTGLVYYGEYECSLDTGSLWKNNGLCEPTRNEELIINWK